VEAAVCIIALVLYLLVYKNKIVGTKLKLALSLVPAIVISVSLLYFIH